MCGAKKRGRESVDRMKLSNARHVPFRIDTFEQSEREKKITLTWTEFKSIYHQIAD